jgi:ferredoxin-NADP reductase
VASVVPEAPGVVSIYVTGRDLSKLDVQAGQFFRWRFLTRDSWWQAHPFSLSAAPNGQWLRLTVKSLGDHSRALAGLRPGVRIWLEGPSGGFTSRARRRERSVLIAGGIGIAPIRALIEDLPSGSTVLYRARAASEVIFQRELTDLVNTRGHQLHYLIGPRSQSQASKPLTPEGLRALVPDVRNRDVYLCGPATMTASVMKTLAVLRVPRRHIHVDPFEL